MPLMFPLAFIKYTILRFWTIFYAHVLFAEDIRF